MKTAHHIVYSIVNEKQLDFFFKVYVNDAMIFSKNYTYSVEKQELNFLFDYKDSASPSSSIKIVTNGTEQYHKMLQVHSIKINKQPLDIYHAFYYPEKNEYWKNLSPDEYKQNRKQVVKHASRFGWFGTVEYEYEPYSSKINKVKQNLVPLQRIKI